MPDIDFALAWDFIDPDDGKPRQLRFRRNYAPPGDKRVFDGTGQLYAAVADGARNDNGDEVPISRDGVSFEAVETALDGWEDWATLHVHHNGIDRWMNLALIRQRINAAGLGLTGPDTMP